MARVNTPHELDGLRQGTRVRDKNGQLVGQVREVSGRSILVGEAGGRRVFWVPAELVEPTSGREVRLNAVVRSDPHGFRWEAARGLLA